MTTFEVVEAKPFYVGMMLRRLRSEHRNALLSLGINAHRELRKTFDASSFRRAWLIDGELAGLGGVTGTLAGFTGSPWLTLSQDALRYPKQIIREARRHLYFIMQTHSELTTTVLCGDRAAIRFAQFLGFHASHDRQTKIGAGEVMTMVLPRDLPR